MNDLLIHDPCSMVIYEEEVTTAHEIPSTGRHWSDEKSVGYELTDTKCYKTPSGVQKTATIQREQLSTSKEQMTEQIVEMDGEYSIEGTDMLYVPCLPSTSTSPPSNDPTVSSTSQHFSHQPEPLRRMAIKIGERVLRFKVINATDAPEAPIDPSDGWISDPKPLTAPKALAGLYHCANCKTYFGNKEVYQRHVLEVHGDARPFRCFNCGMRFANKTSMTHHLKDHSLLKPMYSCDYCPRIFAKLESKMRHHKLHFTRSTCQQCMRFFTTEEALRNHQSTAHPANFDEGPPSEDLLPNGKTARFSCNYCNLRFHFKKDMLVHERVHTGEKPYECGYCMKSFAQSQALTAHIRTHTRETPYQCRKCTKSFRDNSCLRKHELSAHTDTPIVRAIPPEYTEEIEKQIDLQRVKKHQQMMVDRHPNFRM
ncbi:CRE-ZFP-2 protein [Caenorhabditis remanei]|uniref:CRE-ZFP-2 protein n=1 Tax=Caenorhabditis remanei TaxID=31234 RepID=E3NB30_CAERE|nr:CRE-ZFP-2 protein [Caenorhabditis remanei]